MNFKRLIDVESNVFLFIAFFAILFGPAFGFSDVYDHISNVDVQTYVGLSEFNFDQHPVRRYRVIIPMLAAGIHFVFEPILDLLSPHDFPGDFSRIMSFVFVNTMFMAGFAVLLFRIVQTVVGKNNYWPAFLGVVSVLTCRWTMLFAGSALIDSLYLVVLGLLLLGILRKELWLVVVAIYLGPWAKEAFIFFVPLLVFVDKKHWLKLIVHLVVSGILIFGFRYFFDQAIGAEFGESLDRDLSHFAVVPLSLQRLFSFHGLYEIFSIGGVWNILLILGLCIKEVRSLFKNRLGMMWWVLTACVLIQALLSYELARMFYLLTPLLAIGLALIFEYAITLRNPSNT